MSIAAALRAEGGALGAAVLADPPTEPGPAQLAASGPRVAARAAEYELLIEMILEGSLLHYGSPRFVSVPDRDLALLLGDQLYALGLSRLAALGDLDAVTELADVISLLAQAHSDGNPGLASAIWDAGAVAVGWGGTDEVQDAKALVRGGDASAEQALRAAVAAARDATS